MPDLMWDLLTYGPQAPPPRPAQHLKVSPTLLMETLGWQYEFSASEDDREGDILQEAQSSTGTRGQRGSTRMRVRYGQHASLPKSSSKSFFLHPCVKTLLPLRGYQSGSITVSVKIPLDVNNRNWLADVGWKWMYSKMLESHRIMGMAQWDGVRGITEEPASQAMQPETMPQTNLQTLSAESPQPTQHQALLEAAVHASASAGGNWACGFGSCPFPEWLLHNGYKVELPAAIWGRHVWLAEPSHISVCTCQGVWENDPNFIMKGSLHLLRWRIFQTDSVLPVSCYNHPLSFLVTSVCQSPGHSMSYLLGAPPQTFPVPCSASITKDFCILIVHHTTSPHSSLRVSNLETSTSMLFLSHMPRLTPRNLPLPRTALI